jgi:uncharacterized protein YqjF (DUF2071 family)
MPGSAWKFTMSWSDLAFFHWPMSKATLRSQLPPGLGLDTFEDEAWIGVVPFRMADVRARLLPPVPTLTEFPELNVRTYVTAGGKPGVWFFSLDAASWLAVRGARTWFHLPYFDARMSIANESSGVHYESERSHRGAPAARFSGTYRASGDLLQASPGSLEHFLTERYCLYAADSGGRLYRSEIHHARWRLRAAESEFRMCDMTRIVEAELPDVAPLAHVAERIDVVGWFPYAL